MEIGLRLVISSITTLGEERHCVCANVLRENAGQEHKTLRKTENPGGTDIAHLLRGTLFLVMH